MHGRLQQDGDAPRRKTNAIGDELVGLAQEYVRDDLALLLGQPPGVAKVRRVRYREKESASVRVEPVDQAPATIDQCLPGFEGFTRIGFAELAARSIDDARSFAEETGEVDRQKRCGRQASASVLASVC